MMLASAVCCRQRHVDAAEALPAADSAILPPFAPIAQATLPQSRCRGADFYSAARMPAAKAMASDEQRSIYMSR